MKLFSRLVFLFALLNFIYGNNVIAQWQQSNGPEGGGITRLASVDSTIFCGTISGIFTTTDYGNSWMNRSSGLPTTFIYSIYTNGLEIFAATYEGVFKSTDLGLNWNESNNGIATDGIFALTGTGSALFAGTMNGVYKSVDDGENWIRVDTGFTSSFINDFAVIGSNVFTATDDGVYLSTDLGNTWESANNGITGGVIFTMDALNSDVFAGTPEGVFVSSDMGANWSNISNGLTPPSVHSLKVFNDIMFAGVKDNGTFYSTDGGANWNPTDPSLNNPYENDFLELQNNYFAASDNGVYKSSDGINLWEMKSSGIISTSIRAFINVDSEILCGTFGAYAFFSADSGNSWQQYPNLNARGILAFAKSDSSLFAATSTDGLFKSSDNGVSWERILSAVRDSYFRTVNANGNTILTASSSQGAYRSSDNGNSWLPVDASLTDTDIDDFSFIDNYVFASTTFSGFIFRSTDDGLTWSESSNGLSPYSSVHTIIKSGNYLFAAAGDGIYRSSDYGDNWDLVVNGMNSTSTLSILAIGSTLLTGTSEGYIYKSTDFGDNWTNFSDGLPAIGSTSANVILYQSDQYVLCGTYSTGIYRRPVSEIVVTVDDQNEGNSPVTFNLSQNYPNPFNPLTRIGYQIPEAGNVSLKIYNMLGQEVAILVNKYQTKGKYEINFDASGLTSGVYIYKLQVNDFSSSKKMILLK